MRVCCCALPKCLAEGCQLDAQEAPVHLPYRQWPTPPGFVPQQTRLVVPLTEEDIRRIVREELGKGAS